MILALSLSMFEIETNRLSRDTAIFIGPPNVVTNAGFTVAPAVVYSPILPVPLPRFKLVTNKFPAEDPMPSGRLSPETSAGVYGFPEGRVFANRAGLKVRDEDPRRIGRFAHRIKRRKRHQSRKN